MLINSLDPERLLIGEYATPNAEVLTAYIESMQHRMHLFDFALHANFVRFSRAARPDLRKMLDGALVKLKPETTVTFVNNHDTVSDSFCACGGKGGY